MYLTGAAGGSVAHAALGLGRSPGAPGEAEIAARDAVGLQRGAELKALARENGWELGDAAGGGFSFAGPREAASAARQLVSEVRERVETHNEFLDALSPERMEQPRGILGAERADEARRRLESHLGVTMRLLGGQRIVASTAFGHAGGPLAERGADGRLSVSAFTFAWRGADGVRVGSDGSAVSLRGGQPVAALDLGPGGGGGPGPPLLRVGA